MSRDALIDPRTGETVVLRYGHATEDADDRVRRITELTPIAAGWKPTKTIKQQGARSPRVLRYSGIADDAMHQALVRFFVLCRTQTVHFVTATGEQHEALISKYQPQRQGVVRGPRGERHIRRISLEVEVVNTL